MFLTHMSYEQVLAQLTGKPEQPGLLQHKELWDTPKRPNVMLPGRALQNLVELWCKEKPQISNFLLLNSKTIQQSMKLLSTPSVYELYMVPVSTNIFPGSQQIIFHSCNVAVVISGPYGKMYYMTKVVTEVCKKKKMSNSYNFGYAVLKYT